MDGALLLDKPVGLTSNAALQRAKRLMGARKAGHAGTLDPLASGLLVVLFGEATKFAGPLLDDDKEYVATVKLGEQTSTGDAEGEVLKRLPVEAGRELLVEKLKAFVGEIEQVPPMYSALKRDGVPLYKLARKGETVTRKPRRVRIAAIELLRFEAPLAEIRVRCSKGTYVRTLGEDIGLALGTVAHLSALRRTGSGRFSIDGSIGLEALESLDSGGRTGQVLGLPQLLGGLPRADLDVAVAGRFRHGQTVPCEGGEGVCGVYGPDGTVIGLGRRDGAGGLHPVRLTSTQEAE